MAEVVRLAMWSGPRNISTAMMRSWENRPDSIVVDEPLYAHFLAATGIDHPGRDEVLAVGETDWRRVVATLLRPLPDGVAVFYQKQMAHHLTADMSHDWMSGLTNVLLIRDPREVVASYLKSRRKVTLDDIGVVIQCQLFDELASRGASPLIIDAADFLLAPERYQRALCASLGLPFFEGMLHWPPGPRESDGAWAPYWYDAVLTSTCFEPYRQRAVSLDGAPAHVAADAMPYYERLWAMRWRP